MEVFKGDTFGRKVRHRNGKTGEAIDLTGAVIVWTVRTPDFKFSTDLQCVILNQSYPENKGRYLVSPADTNSWPVGRLMVKITRTQYGVTISESAEIIVKVA